MISAKKTKDFLSMMRGASVETDAPLSLPGGYMAKLNRRADHDGPHRSAFEKNRKRILATQNVCAYCGKLVDKTLPPHDPMSAQVDHKIPISKGGHPSDIENLCLTHACCNRAKSDKVFLGAKEEKGITNQNLPWTLNWFEVAK